MTQPWPPLVRSASSPAARAVCGKTTFGYDTYITSALPDRIYVGLDDADRPPSILHGQPAIDAEVVPTPLAVLLRGELGSQAGWPTESRRSVARLETLWLLTEDRYRRLDSAEIEPLAHQAALVEHVLADPKLHRVLIADEVGLGKTIEAGLLIKRLQDVSPGIRVLYLTEARLVPNVIEEFAKLDLRPRAREWTAEHPEARLIPGDSDPLVVASIHRAVFNHSVVGASGPWDVIVVDEAHHLTDWSPDGSDPQQRLRLVKLLIENRLTPDGRLVLLTGTPHQGHRDRIRNLLRLLSPNGNERDARGKVIYRIKDDITGWDNEPLFPDRRVNPHRLIGVSPAYHDWMTAVHSLLTPPPGGSRASGWRRAQALQFCASSPQAGLAYLVRLAVRTGLRAQANPVLRRALEAVRPYRDGAADEPASQLEARLGQGQTELDEYDQDVFDGGHEHLCDVLMQGTELVEGGAFDEKLGHLMELLAEAPEEKFVVFAQPIETVYLLRARLQVELGAQSVAMIVGGQNAVVRKREIERFMRADGGRVLVSSRSGGEGINLQVARRLVHFDIPWNPMEMEQRVGRVHRYGGSQTVIVDTLVLENSRETRVLDRARARLGMIASDLDQNRFERLFSRTMALVPVDLLTQLMAGENFGPLTPAEEERIDRLIAEGLSRERETEAEFRARAASVQHVDRGAADYPDFHSWLIQHANAAPAEGWTRWVLEVSTPGAEPKRRAHPAALLRLGDRVGFVAPESAVGLQSPDGGVARPVRFGLNDREIAGKVREVIGELRGITGAGLLLVDRSAWLNWLPGEARAACGRGAVVSAYLIRKIDPTTQTMRELETHLHCVLWSEDGGFDLDLSAAQAAELIRLVREPRPKVKKGAFCSVPALLDREARLMQHLRETASGGPVAAIFPIAALWIEPA